MDTSSTKSGAGTSRPPRPLTHKMLESLRPGPTPYRVPDARTKGLAARVATDGRVSWDCSFRISGARKARRVSLGSWPSDASLEEARWRKPKAGAFKPSARKATVKSALSAASRSKNDPEERRCKLRNV
jgi:hypothetical protein